MREKLAPCGERAAAEKDREGTEAKGPRSLDPLLTC